MPRPTLPPEERLSETVFTLVRPDERADLDEYSRELGRSRSEIMREAFLEWRERHERTRAKTA